MIFTVLKKYFIILIITLLCYVSSFSQIDSSEIRLSGFIACADTNGEALFVHVINLRTNMGVISDTSGFFSTKIRKKDTILFRCLGFSDLKFNLPDTVTSTNFLINIALSSTSYNIKTVDIYALSRLNQLHYDIKNFDYNDDIWKKRIYIPGITKGRYTNSPKAIASILPPSAGGPLGILYNTFSKKLHSLEKLVILLKEDEIKKANENKYNKQILQEFTGYTDTKLERFYYFLNYPYKYIQETSSYDIHMNIKSQMPIFEKSYKKTPTKLNNLIKK